MRPLRNCDFCTDDALGTFEVLPPELEPTEAEQQRLALCEKCKGRLEGVIEPLLTRLDASTREDEPADERTPTEITIGGEGTVEESTDADSSHGEEDRLSEDGTTGDDPNELLGTDEDEPDRKTRPPRAYAKVMRLLRNREFPMKRAAVEELAAGAYDLETHEAAAIVDHAIDDGELLEDGGTLRRP
ncbi:hypothetical protein ACYJ1Y_01930 [Natrialbaceae archaeon A-gly3]